MRRSRVVSVVLWSAVLVCVLSPVCAQNVQDLWLESVQDCSGTPCFTIMNASASGPWTGSRNLQDLWRESFQNCSGTPCLTVTGAGGGGSGYDTIQDEGTSLTQRSILNFAGAGVTCVDDAGGSRTTCTISGGGSVTGSGTANTIPIWTSSSALGDSLLTVPTAGVLSLGYGLRYKTASKSADFTFAASDYQINCTAGSGGITGTLPAASGVTGQTYHYCHVDSGAGACALAPNGSDTLNGVNATDATLTVQHACKLITWESSSGWIVTDEGPIMIGDTISGGTIGQGLYVADDGSGNPVLGQRAATSQSYLRTATVTLDTATVLTLGTTPAILVAAPGAQRAIIPQWLVLEYVFNTEPFGLGSNGDPGHFTIFTGDYESSSAFYGYEDTFDPTNGFLDATENRRQSFALAHSTVNDPPAGSLSTDWDNQALKLSTDGHDPALGRIVTLSLVDGGTGWAVNDTFTIDAYTSTATGHVVAETGGVATSIALDSGGKRYGIGTTTTTATGGSVGTGLTVSIDSIAQGDGALMATVTYVVIDTTTGAIIPENQSSPPALTYSGTAQTFAGWTDDHTLGNAGIGYALTGATAGSLLFVDGSGKLGQDPDHLSYANSLIRIGTDTVGKWGVEGTLGRLTIFDPVRDNGWSMTAYPINTSTGAHKEEISVGGLWATDHEAYGTDYNGVLASTQIYREQWQAADPDGSLQPNVQLDVTVDSFVGSGGMSGRWALSTGDSVDGTVRERYRITSAGTTGVDGTACTTNGSTHCLAGQVEMQGGILQETSTSTKHHIRIHLTASQMRTLFSAPVTLVASPGSGKMILPADPVVWHFVANTIPFSNPNSQPTVSFSWETNDAFDSGAFAVTPETTNQTYFDSITETLKNVIQQDDTTNFAGKALILSAPSDSDTGTIATATINNGGAAYAAGDTGAILGGSGGNYQVTSVSAGVVTGITITAAGDYGYAVQNGYATSAITGIGTGLTLDVTVINPADGDVYLTLPYYVVTLP